VQPQVLVCLGATAAQALIDRKFRVTQQRGRPVESTLAPVVIATVHPSSILRSDDRDAEFAAFVSDLRSVAAHL
jgi:DNA polymerase